MVGLVSREESMRTRSSSSRMRVTFHVAFAFVDYKAVASIPTLFVSDNSYPLDRSICFKLSSNITVGSGFRLYDVSKFEPYQEG